MPHLTQFFSLQRLYYAKEIYFENAFIESLDGYSVGLSAGASAVIEANGIVVDTGAVLNNSVYIAKGISQAKEQVPTTWGKARRFSCVLEPLEDLANSEGWLVTGSALINEPRVGFKTEGNTLKGCVSSGAAISLTASLGAVTTRRLEALLVPNVAAYFFVDGVYKASLTTNLPFGAAYAGTPLIISLRTLDAVTKTVGVYRWKWLQYA